MASVLGRVFPKLIFAVLAGVAFVCSLVMASIWFIEEHYQYGDLKSFPRFRSAIRVTYDSDRPLEYYSEAGPNRKVEGSIERGATLIYAYQGSSGVYTYALVAGKVRQFRRPLSKGYYLFGAFFPFERLSSVAKFGGSSSLGALLLVISAILITRRKSRAPSENRFIDNEMENGQPELASVHTTQNRAPELNTTQPVQGETTVESTTSHPSRATANAIDHHHDPSHEIERLAAQIEALHDENSRLREEHTAEVENLHKRHKRIVEQYESDFQSSEAVWREFEERQNVQVLELTRSLQALENQVEIFKQDIQALGYDFDDTKYRAIIKGRKFEIFVAQALQNEYGCEILEWTPDKGGLQKLKVKQNGNPDLLFRSPSGRAFAVECKYRKSYTRIENLLQGESKKWFNWAKKEQYERYKKFSERFPVYLGLGYANEPDNPLQCLVIPLEELFFESKEKTVKFGSGSEEDQLCFEHRKFHSDSHCAIKGDWSALVQELT